MSRGRPLEEFIKKEERLEEIIKAMRIKRETAIQILIEIMGKYKESGVITLPDIIEILEEQIV